MPTKRVRVQLELWAPKSRGGLDEYFAGEFYEDKPFDCRACGKPSVFTAEQQKYTYEVKKALIHEQHVLCESCFTERTRLEAASVAFLKLWKHNKAVLQAHVGELGRWKEVLVLLPKYGVRQDTARIRMLTKLLAKAS
jgi:Probable zinc-ribbon domain